MSEQNPVVEMDNGDGRGFQPVDAAAAQIAQLSVHDHDDEDEEIDIEAELAKLPKKVQLRIAALRTLQEGQAALEEEFEKERRALELKYEKLYQPFYSQRAEIVTGAKEVETVTSGEGLTQEDLEGEDADVKGIPGFWLRAFMNHSVLADLVHERDLPAFEFLLDIRSTSHETDNGFKLEFDFAENPFFTNTTLTKEYDIGEASESGDAVLRNCSGTVIDWKAGQNLCEVTKKVKQRAKGSKAGETRVVTRTEPCDSFFQFFAPVEMPSEDDEDVRLPVFVVPNWIRVLTIALVLPFTERHDHAPAHGRLRDRLHGPRDHHPAGSALVHGRGCRRRRLGIRSGRRRGGVG